MGGLNKARSPPDFPRSLLHLPLPLFPRPSFCVVTFVYPHTPYRVVISTTTFVYFPQHTYKFHYSRSPADLSFIHLTRQPL